MFDTYKRVEATIAGRKIVLETGHMARQAHGSVIATIGDSRVFAAVTCGGARPEIDFFPLVVDYREKTEAAGKIPGGFFKREGRPTTKEILTMRLTDRAIRPLFADGFKQEVQVMSFTMQYDGENNTDVASMIAASRRWPPAACPSRQSWVLSVSPTSTTSSSPSPATRTCAATPA
jgi:polyribonucleotide nucleotidyltransferase